MRFVMLMVWQKEADRSRGPLCFSPLCDTMHTVFQLRWKEHEQKRIPQGTAEPLGIVTVDMRRFDFDKDKVMGGTSQMNV